MKFKPGHIIKHSRYEDSLSYIYGIKSFSYVYIINDCFTSKLALYEMPKEVIDMTNDLYSDIFEEEPNQDMLTRIRSYFYGS